MVTVRTLLLQLILPKGFGDILRAAETSSSSKEHGCNSICDEHAERGRMLMSKMGRPDRQGVPMMHGCAWNAC